MKTLEEYLEALGTGLVEPHDLRAGICYQVEQEYGEAAVDHIVHFWSSWEHYSGDKAYPVGDSYSPFVNLWASGKRQDLCLHLAKEIRAYNKTI